MQRYKLGVCDILQAMANTHTCKQLTSIEKASELLYWWTAKNLKEEMKQNRGFIGSKAAEVRQGVLTTRTECGH